MINIASTTGFTDALRKSVTDATSAATKYSLGVDNNIGKTIMSNFKVPNTTAVLSDIKLSTITVM